MKNFNSTNNYYTTRILWLIFSTFFSATSPIAYSSTVMDMSALPAKRMTSIAYDPKSGVTAGIFRNISPDKKVEISNGWVGPVGAGVFFGSKDKPAIKGECWFVTRTKIEKGMFLLTKLPLKSTIHKYWHESEVIADLYIKNKDGTKRRVGFAKPLNGHISSLSIKIPSHKKSVDLALNSKGTVNNGNINIKDIGNAQIRFLSQLGNNECYFETSKNSVKKLLNLLQ